MKIGKVIKTLVRVAGPVGTVLGFAATVFTGISKTGEVKEAIQKMKNK